MRYGFQAYVVFLIFASHFSAQCLPSVKNQDLFRAYQLSLENSKQALDGFKVEPISFEVQKSSKDTTTFTRKGFLAVRPDALGTVIICHGYTQSKHESFFLKTMFPYFNVLAFDFRAHGELIDEQQFSTIGRDEMYDVLGAVNFVKAHEQLQDKPIFGCGFSMGAVSLLQAQAEFGNLFDALVLDSPFDSSSDCMSQSFDKMLTYKIFGRTYKLPGKKLLMKAMYSDKMYPIVKAVFKRASGIDPRKTPTKFVPVLPIDQASNIMIPCLFISCQNDKSIAVDRVRRLYDTVQSSFKRFWITPGAKHCGSCFAQPERYAYQVNNFIKQVLQHDFATPEQVQDERVTIQAA